MFRFCRSKCHRHFKAKHNPRRVAWTKAYRKTHGKQLANDTIFDFQQKRNEPLVYNRDLYVKTIAAMQKIHDIRQRRQRTFWNNRMRIAKIKKNYDLNKQLEKHVDLIDDKEMREEVQENVNMKKEAEKKKRTQTNRPKIIVAEEGMEEEN